MKAVFFILAIMVVLAGCKDISGATKANFGTTGKDKAAMDYFTGKYGDVTQKGTPRLLEPLLTTNIVEYLPADKVLKYSKSVDAFYFWFVYDNFNENDKITVDWKYQGTSIGTSDSATGADFGRASFVLNKPDAGWPIGQYTVTVTGRGTSASASFEVIDGATVTEKLPFENTVTNTPTANPPATNKEVVLMDNGNVGACSYTDTSTFTVTEDLYVTKLRMWYFWASGEKTLPYTLTKDGVEFSKGELQRAACDPYQTSWCEANYYANRTFPAGSYVLKSATAKLCQNSQSKGNGMYIVYGWKTGTTTPAPTPSGTSASGFTVTQTSCAFTGSWSSNWGAMEFKQDGTGVTATYTHDQGKIAAKMNGNILVGKWSEYPSYAEPGDAGDVELELSSDCKSFTGNWRYGSAGGWSGGWTGSRS